MQFYQKVDFLNYAVTRAETNAQLRKTLISSPFCAFLLFVW